MKKSKFPYFLCSAFIFEWQNMLAMNVMKLNAIRSITLSLHSIRMKETASVRGTALCRASIRLQVLVQF